MRLIDAGELIKSLKEIHAEYTEHYKDDLSVFLKHYNYFDGLTDAIRDVHEQPTIKAIPIDWITNHLKEHEGTGWEAVYRAMIVAMVAEWGKENETD